MKSLVNLFWETKWTALLTIFLTVLGGHLLVRGGFAFYNTHAPVVDMRATLVHQDSNSTLIHITGTKMRHCKFVRINAMYTFKGNGMLVDAFLERVDGPPVDGSTKPVGTYDLGHWRIWPTDSATKVIVLVHHECGGETVLSKVAEVTLAAR